MEDTTGTDAPSLTETQASDPVELVHSLLNEAQLVRSNYEANWDRNQRQYGGDQWDTLPPEGLRQVTLNMTKRAIDSICAVMTEQRPRTTLSPRETLAPGIAYINQQAGSALAAQLLASGQAIQGVFDPADPDTSPLLTGEPITDDIGKMLVEMQLLPEDAIVVVNDSTIAAACKTVIDGMWDRGHWLWWIAEAIQAALVIGHRDVEFGWDYERQMPIITSYPAKNTWIDPNATDYENAQYGIVARVMSIDEAVAQFPQHADAIRRSADQNVTNIANATLSSIYGILYERDMTLLITAWVRNQPFEVEMQDEAGNIATEQRTGIRKMMVIDSELLYDGMCEFDDIPLIRFKNIPIPDRPYALGEPEILRDAQEIVNRIPSIILNQLRYYQTPQIVMSQSVRESQGANAIYSHPGKIWTIPDAAYHAIPTGQKPLEIIEPPRIDGAQLETFNQFVAVFNELAGQTDVMRGEAPSGVTSGVAIDSLRREARGTIGLRSMWIERAVTRMTAMTLSMIRDHLTPEGWKLYTDKYSPQVLEAIQARLKQAEFDIVIEMAAGRGETRQSEMQKAQVMREGGNLSQESYMEAMGVPDPEDEIKKIQREQADMILTQQALAAQNTQSNQGNGSSGGKKPSVEADR